MLFDALFSLSCRMDDSLLYFVIVSFPQGSSDALYHSHCNSMSLAFVPFSSSSVFLPTCQVFYIRKRCTVAVSSKLVHTNSFWNDANIVG